MKRNISREALDTLGIALANHGHEWTDTERTAYENAISECSVIFTENDIAGALFDFIGSLSKDSNTMRVGYCEDAKPLLDKFERWAEHVGLNIKTPNMRWNLKEE